MEQRYSDSYGDKEDKEPLAVDEHDITENTDENLILDDYTPENKRINKKLTAAISGIVLTTMLLSGCSSETSKATSPNQPIATSATDQANPNKSTTQTPAQVEVSNTSSPEKLPTIESLEMNASLLSDPKLLIETAVDRSGTQWFNAGATPENAQIAMKYKGGIPAYAEKIAAEYDELFISALLVDNWESNPILVKWVDNVILIHKQTLALYFYTSFPDIEPKDKEPYMRGTKIKKIVSINNAPDGSYVSVTEDEYDYDNADLNRVGEDLTNGAKVLNTVFEPMITLKKVGDKAKISNIILGPDVTNK